MDARLVSREIPFELVLLTALQGANTAMNPFSVLREAIRAVPAVRYALAVAGIISVIAIVQAFNIGLRVALVGAIAVLVLMVVMVIFARLSRTAGHALNLPALVLTWFCLALTIATATVLFFSVFFRVPVNLTSWLGVHDEPTSNSVPAEARFHFDNTGTWFGVYASGIGTTNIVGNTLIVTIETGRVTRNPNSHAWTIKYISVEVAKAANGSWNALTESEKQSVDWRLKTASDSVALDGMRFSMPLLNREQLKDSFLIVDLSDGDGIFHAPSSGTVF